MALGELLAGAYLGLLAFVAILSIAGRLETFTGAEGRGRLADWRQRHPRVDLALRANGAANQILSIVAVVGLVVWAVVNSVVADLGRLLEWGLRGPLFTDALWLVALLYVLLGVSSVVSQLATEQVLPLVKQAVDTLRTFVTRQADEDEALLQYSYRRTR